MNPFEYGTVFVRPDKSEMYIAAPSLLALERAWNKLAGNRVKFRADLAQRIRIERRHA